MLEGETVILTDEEGNEHEFEIIDVIEVSDRRYAVLAVPDNEEEAIVLRFDSENGHEVLVTIDNDEEWESVAEAWEGFQEEEDEEEPN